MPLARENAVPSGSALSVEREGFSKSVENALNAYPDFTLIREEVTSLDDDMPTVIASGPLTSDALAEKVGQLTGKNRLGMPRFACICRAASDAIGDSSRFARLFAMA